MDTGIKIGLGSFVATAALLLAVPASADAHEAHGNGSTTRAEVEARVAARFAAMDADGDGAVTRAEADAYRQARQAERRGRLFARLDADGDGSIDAEERAAIRGRHHRRGGHPVARPEMAEEANMRARLTPEELAPLTQAAGDDAVAAPPEHAERRAGRAERRAQIWAEADADGDGALSEAEFAAAAAARQERSRAHRGDRPDRFASADADGDGSLTLAEVQARAFVRFDHADANSDGRLTREERRAAWRALRAERSAPDSQ
ncbi:MAG: hypothetical protein ABR601_09965 [Parasphingopyxis sp.]|nr:hypothetical protein [Sphingomonadales bacterium]